jgi:hypothetical protein
MKRVNLVTSVDNSSKQMQQTSGSSSCRRIDGDESGVDEVAVVVVCFLLMVCGNWNWSNCLGSTVVVVFYGGGDVDVIGD